MGKIADSAPPRQFENAEEITHRNCPGSKTGPIDQLRHRRAVGLVPTVRAVFGGFRVASARHDSDYLVTQPNGHLVCPCRDFTGHQDEPGFKCKHVLAVGLAKKEGRLAKANPSAGPDKSASSNGPSVLSLPLAQESPTQIKLSKTQKGSSWEISVTGQNPEQVLAQLQGLEAKIKDIFGDQ
ncbi:MAG: hypothetical protein GKR89_35875 [Candidatus Latescibacteria bacterium]|nr:hypothetical protein [Candidatus Latescibacterota bacterium]